LKQIIGEVLAGFGAVVIEVETMPDRVDLLVDVPAQVAVSQLVQMLKGRWSRRLGQQFAHLARMTCLCSPSWLVCTVGGAPRDVVRRYVDNQKVAAGCRGKAG
jgi:putative transposase